MQTLTVRVPDDLYEWLHRSPVTEWRKQRYYLGVPGVEDQVIEALEDYRKYGSHREQQVALNQAFQGRP